eukprot:m.47401 g.47401  ORF g.47401 m.47401 type:complete len:100 (+) comp13220_c1_seq11:118-417(+)
MSSTSDSFELLFRACDNGNLEALKLVLNSTPADQRAALCNQHNHDCYGWTPLIAASCRGHVDIVSHLIDVGQTLKVELSTAGRLCTPRAPGSAWPLLSC